MLRTVGYLAFRPVLCRRLSDSAKSVRQADKYLTFSCGSALNWNIIKKSFAMFGDVKAVRVASDDNRKRAYIRFSSSVDLKQVLIDYDFLAKRYNVKPVVYEPPVFELPSNELLCTKHILISNLPERLSWGELKDFISFIGDVQEFRWIGSDCIATFISAEEASLAKYLLNGSVFQNRVIKLSEYNEPIPSADSVPDQKERFTFDDHQVYITHLPLNTTESEVRDALAREGIVDVRCAAMLDDQTGTPLNACRVEFRDLDSVQKAIQLFHNVTKIKGQKVFVRTIMSVGDRKLEIEQRTLFLYNLPNTYLSQPVLKSLFVDLNDDEILHLNALPELQTSSKAIAYVEFDSPATAMRALDIVQNTPHVNGHKIQAQPMHELLRSVYLKAVQQFRFNDEMNIRTFDIRCVVEVKVPLNMNEKQVRKIFERYGYIRNILIKLDLFGNSSGWCTIEYDEPWSVNRAIAKMDGVSVDGHKYIVTNGPVAREVRVHEKESREVVVTNLPRGATKELVRSHFEQMGAVADCFLQDSMAFVHYEEADSAQNARERLHNGTFMDGTIFVSTAWSGGEKNRPTPKSADGNVVRHIKVRFVHPDVDHKELAEHFEAAGKVKYCTIHRTPQGESKETATVEYFLPESASKALNLLYGSSVRGQTIHLRLKSSKERNKRANAKQSGEIQT